ncbi:type III pantothenate kinase [Cobetia sp. cqz5-12]|jgi:type III pantothenate kinase|uniref:Type III pantothenate kinase n=2 Tax=Cobetia TaxID=204286 RepID=A0AAP4X120_9GAMM|nr:MULTISPECIES: type III pantothenate kinase [Cobetia]AVV34243.1 type III pantothenate kinase [Halomonas sp. SF2003]MBR9798766.1 type III pantothenate kinase [Gammaproteobacteria bacterium]TCJ27446.1 type III pantothenate kinase [Halomonas sp. GDM18]KPM76122.1 type III pantothenate kinase [Cobetia sp. UCD-24C]MBE2170171.1 type III pantothenate kinase [Cobetia sp. 2AS1]|tara:strand:- start:314 stop:1153 length:840 start_codon:yes stop_codon:yes gene_type:complete
MILDLDIGNTLSKWRLKDTVSSEIRSRGAVWTREEWRPGADIPDLDVVTAVRISSVARKQVLDETVELLRKQVGVVHVAHSTREALGVTCGYEEPQRLGVDRWLGALAGHHLTGGCCSVDCGSAITVDFVLPGGKHLGGYILPGLRLMKESLKLGTRNVAIDPDTEVDTLLAPGRNTVEAVNHGIYMAAVSAVNRLYAEVCDREGVALPLLLTGGDARVVARGLRVPHALWPDMVYAGLEALYPLTAAERAGRLSGAPDQPRVPDLEKLRSGLALTQML